MNCRAAPLFLCFFAAAQEPTAAVTFDLGSPRVGVRWRGAQEYRLRGVQFWRGGLGTGRVQLDFSPDLERGVKAASAWFRVPDAARVHVVAGYDRSGALHSECFENGGVLLPEGWRQQDGVLVGGVATAGWWVIGNRQWRDVRVGLRVVVGEEPVRIACRWQDENNHVVFAMDPDSGRYWLALVSGGIERVLAETEVDRDAGAWMDLVIEAREGRVRVSVDGRALLSGNIGGPGRGAIALRGPGARFDDLAVESALIERTRPLLDEDFAARVLAGFEAWVPAGVSEERGWLPGAGLLHHRAFAPEEAGDKWSYLLPTRGDAWTDLFATTRVRFYGTGAAGLVFRYSGSENHYRVLWSENGRLVLSRLLGGQEHVLGSTEVIRDEQVQHDLAVQVHGFRIEVFIDDAPLLRVMDGAHERGRVGLIAAVDCRAAFDRLTVVPPLRTVPVLVSVRNEGECRIHGAHPEAAGADVWLGFSRVVLPVARLDEGDGFPPFLLTWKEDPYFLIGQRSPGVRGFATSVSSEGIFSARIQWPLLPALHGLPFSVTGWVVDPGGERVIDVLPAVSIF